MPLRIVKRGAPVAALMSDDSVEGGNEIVSMIVGWFKAPGKAFSSLIFGLGVWGLILGIVNVVFGVVVAGQRKVVWAGYLTMGYLWDEPYSNDMVYRPWSDTVFLAMAVAGILWGAWGIHQKVEGGFQTWFKGIIFHPIWTSLVSGREEGGITMSAAAWCLLIGFGFYAYWSLVYWAWTDIGVYAVTAPLLAFGFGLRFLALVNETENSTSES
jgi:hypothetical protein